MPGNKITLPYWLKIITPELRFDVIQEGSSTHKLPTPSQKRRIWLKTKNYKHNGTKKMKM